MKLYLRFFINKKIFLPLMLGFVVGFFSSYLRWNKPAGGNDLADNITQHDINEDYHRMEDTSVADELHSKIKILCWILTSPSNHDKKAKHVKATWGKRCNTLLFMSTTEDKSLPSIALPVKEGRNYLSFKTKEAVKYLYKYYLNETDWFLKADDDTYVILENLRYMLIPYNSSDAIYFGKRFRHFTKLGYMSGGAGYVMSREAIKIFAEQGITKGLCSIKATYVEDVEVGKCMETLKVQYGDTRDSLGRNRFFPLILETQMVHKIDMKFWLWQYEYYKFKNGMDCCSDLPISFHYINPDKMYIYEYLIYHVRVFGVSHKNILKHLKFTQVSNQLLLNFTGIYRE